MKEEEAKGMPTTDIGIPRAVLPGTEGEEVTVLSTSRRKGKATVLPGMKEEEAKGVPTTDI